MKTRTLAILGVLLTVLLAQLACATLANNPITTTAPTSERVQPTSARCNSTAGTPRPSGLIEKVTMALDTQGDTKEPVNPTTSFGTQDTFHAVVAIVDAPADTKLEATWYAIDVGKDVECNTQIDTYPLTTDGSRNVDFTLAPTKGWPSGSYRVEVFVNGTLDQVAFFTVK